MPLPVAASAETSSGAEQIVIGLVNNMPDTALQATERQFHALLSAASRDRAIRLRRFFLPGLPRSEAAQSHIDRHYEDLGALWEDRVDGLIVTGTEPHASAFTDEPYWEALAGLIDTAAEHRISTVWSCLAAHAAVLHRGEIERRRRSERLAGVFDCAKVADHRILAGVPSHWRVPHSRYNELPEDELIARGYRVLSRSEEVGADLFVKEGDSLDVFFQGHPEYEAEDLLGEYRRDVGRFLAGERAGYPDLPHGYFDDSAVAALTAFEQQARRNRDPDLLSSFPFITIGRELFEAWHEPAVRIYSNWIGYLAEGIQCDSSISALAE
jgi:homoserine O-succinyltransferase